MNNYYQELDLDRSLGLDDLNKELSRAESVWKSRRTKAPEKATRMLSLIYEAREVFSSEEAKRKYDSELDSPQVVADADADREARFQRWFEEAKSYLANNEYDLAKSAIERAAQSYNPDSDNDEYFNTAAMIYRSSNDPAKAMELINEAILINPKLWLYQTFRGELYYEAGDLAQAESSFRHAFQLASDDESAFGVGYILGNLALVNFATRNYAMALKLAEEAKKAGDPTGRGEAVLAKASGTTFCDFEDKRAYVLQETSPFEEEIKQYISDIVESGIKPDQPFGWVLAEKQHHYKKEFMNGYGQCEQEENFRYTYYLDKSGSFRVKTKYDYEKWMANLNGLEYVPDDNGENDESCLDETIMGELDFIVSYTGRYTSGEFITGDSFKQIPSNPNDLRSDFSLNLRRTTLLKGFELRNKLKEIADKAQIIIEENRRIKEETERINKLFDAEFIPKQQEITSKYEKAKAEIEAKYSPQIAEANRKAPERLAISKEIDALNAELKSLGMFKGKQKKALNEKIGGLRQKMADIITPETLENRKRVELQELEKEEGRETQALRNEIRSKYPLPSRQ